MAGLDVTPFFGPTEATKAELFELAFDNLPENRYAVHEIAVAYEVKIVL